MAQNQTLEQRRRNAKFAKDQDSRRGKSEADVKLRAKEVSKPAISPWWIGLLAFVVLGGLVFELVSRLILR